MGALKRIALTVLTLACVSPAHASGELHSVFAGCAGRFSAEMEHAWLTGDAAADRLHDQRQDFLTMMEATMPPESARDLLQHRLDHKLAHASLLTIATFSQDERHARAARHAANSYRLGCKRLLLRG